MFVQRSGNPTLNAFQAPRYEDLGSTQFSPAAQARTDSKAGLMTLQGTVVKTALLLTACAVSALLVWKMMTASLFGVTLSPMLAFAGGGLGGFVLAIVISFKPKLAAVLSAPYAALEGAFIAGFSLFVAERWLGGAENPAAHTTIFQAVVLTFGIAAAMLIAYGTGILKGGKVFMGVLMSALGGLVLYTLVLFLGRFLFPGVVPNLYASTSPIGIGFTAICLVLASLFLVLDFRMIDEGVKRGAPKHMEWYGAFSLLVTLVWIYIEVLRLLAKLQSRD
jgi:uncharacterized YccA/Bax inhibitor family protein